MNDSRKLLLRLLLLLLLFLAGIFAYWKLDSALDQDPAGSVVISPQVALEMENWGNREELNLLFNSICLWESDWDGPDGVLSRLDAWWQANADAGGAKRLIYPGPDFSYRGVSLGQSRAEVLAFEAHQKDSYHLELLKGGRLASESTLSFYYYFTSQANIGAIVYTFDPQDRLTSMFVVSYGFFSGSAESSVALASLRRDFSNRYGRPSSQSRLAAAWFKPGRNMYIMSFPGLGDSRRLMSIDYALLIENPGSRPTMAARDKRRTFLNGLIKRTQWLPVDRR